jgi:hypothetical protein
MNRMLMNRMLMNRMLMNRMLKSRALMSRVLMNRVLEAQAGGARGVPLYCTLYLKIFSQIFQSMQKFKGVVDHRHKGVTQRFKAQGTDQCVQRSIYTTPYNLFFIFYHFPY